MQSVNNVAPFDCTLLLTYFFDAVLGLAIIVSVKLLFDEESQAQLTREVVACRFCNVGRWLSFYNKLPFASFKNSRIVVKIALTFQFKIKNLLSEEVCGRDEILATSIFSLCFLVMCLIKFVTS